MYSKIPGTLDLSSSFERFRVIVLVSGGAMLVIAGLAKLPLVTAALFLGVWSEAAREFMVAIVEVCFGCIFVGNSSSELVAKLAVIMFGGFAVLSTYFAFLGTDCGCTGAIPLPAKLIIVLDWVTFGSLLLCVGRMRTSSRDKPLQFWSPFSVAITSLVTSLAICVGLVRSGVASPLGIPIVCVGDFRREPEMSDLNFAKKHSQMYGTVNIVNPTRKSVNVSSLDGFCGFRSGIESAITLQAGGGKRVPVIASGVGQHGYRIIVSSEKRTFMQHGIVRINQ